MKKDRNAFFQNQSSSSYFYPTGQPMNNTLPGMNNNMYPMATESSSNFYQGPVMTPVMPSQDNYSQELESRLAKIERSIKLLDTRVSKLESESVSTNTILENEYTNNNNMYMI